MQPFDENQIVLYLNDARGIYIPRDFAQCTKHECIEGIAAGDLDYLAKGPDQEWYWEIWAEVENNAILTDPKTKIRYRVVQSGDVFLVPEDMELPEDWF